MKVLNPSNRFYNVHSDNVAKIIIAAGSRDAAEKVVDLYIEIVSGTTADPRAVGSHLKAPE